MQHRVFLFHHEDEDLKVARFVVEATSDDGSVAEMYQAARLTKVGSGEGRYWTVELADDEAPEQVRHRVFYEYKPALRMLQEYLRQFWSKPNEVEMPPPIDVAAKAYRMGAIGFI